MLRHIHKTSKELISPEAWKIRIIFWTGAVIVGIFATILAIAGEWADHQFHMLIERWPLAPWIVTPLGLGLLTWITVHFFPGSQGSGIPQSIASLQMTEHEGRNALLSFRIALGKMVLTTLGILCGASIGREGPTVHIGAAVMFSLGKLGRFPYHYMDKGLILAGGAAGIAAAFNTPLGGILFAIEEMGRNFEERTSGVILTAVFIAGVTAVAIEGNYHYFGTSHADLLPEEMILPIVVCGIGGGLLGGLFSTGLLVSGRKLSGFARRNPIRLAILCGLGLAATGWLSGGLAFGTGYHEAKMLVTGQETLPDSYAFFKMLASIFSYLTGIPGGIFAPSLAAGAGVGSFLSSLMPAVPASAVILLGMVGYFSGVVQTPITAAVIVMEMTNNSEMILPLMATAFLARIISGIVCPTPIYEAMAENFIFRPKPEPVEPEEVKNSAS